MWQYVFGIQLSWIVLPLAIFLMLAVGADYNLLLVSRFKEEIGAGLKTGYIRTFLTPSIATLLGRWFWWPLNVRNRPARHPVAARRTSGDLLEEEPDTRPHRVVSPEDPA